MAVLLSSFALGVKSNRNASPKWLFYSLAAMGSAGAVGLLQKYFRSRPCGNELSVFPLCTFVLLTLFSFGMILCSASPRERRISVSSGCVGVCVGIANKVNLFLSGVLPSMVVFPVVNGGAIILSAIGGWIFYHERISPMKWFSLLLGTVGIILLGL